MKVILNKDLATLGEEGDVKDVAKGYARNFLFPRGIALPLNERTKKLFEERREEIENRKAVKRNDAASLKEKLEALSLVLVMPAGSNGKLYGAVTAQTIMDELVKQSFQIERKRIEIPGNTIKSIGKYKVLIKLYENAFAECSVTIEGQPVKTETKASAAPQRRGRRDNSSGPKDAASESSHSTPQDNQPKSDTATPANNVAEVTAQDNPVLSGTENSGTVNPADTANNAE
ncbi:MAG: 50S ribosomal protein L9 [Treponema sp.]|nr:50S ribosomal protein L9 [Treponema sp.]